MTGREPDAVRTELSEDRSATELAPPLTGDGWAAASPRYPDGTFGTGAFDPRSWWPKHQHRFGTPADSGDPAAFGQAGPAPDGEPTGLSDFAAPPRPQRRTPPHPRAPRQSTSSPPNQPGSGGARPTESPGHAEPRDPGAARRPGQPKVPRQPEEPSAPGQPSAPRQTIAPRQPKAPREPMEARGTQPRTSGTTPANQPPTPGAAPLYVRPDATPRSAEQRSPAERPVGPSEWVEELVVRPRAERPTVGWRAAVYSASGGRVNPGVGEVESARLVLVRRVRRHLPGAHQIAVSSLKGGVGKTTVSAVLGLTLAEHRGDRVVALDANPDAGTLADRLTGEVGVTVRQMLEGIDGCDSLTAVSHYTSLAGRLQVLASEQDPAMSEAFSRSEYERICAVLARFYNIIITDSGTGLVHSAMEGTLALADSLVVVGSPTVDGASRASKTLDWLVAHGYAEQVADAVVVLCCDRVSPEIDRERVRAHFLGRSRAVVEVPFDPHLATGGRLDLGLMREETKLAFLELGALIADRFGV